VGAALQESVRAQAEGRTTVIEMMVTKELGDPFRRDALSKPVRHLKKYQSFV
jgi:sulfoacetaldehyde acetyltransferase